MQVVKATNIDEFKHVAVEWKATCNASRFGLEIDDTWFLTRLTDAINRHGSEVFLLKTDEGKVVGYINIDLFDSPLGHQRCVVERNWYVMETYRGRGSIRLLTAAKDWAKEQGCTHLIMNASTLASDLHDKVCEFYKRMDFKLFSTSYIQEII